MSNDGTDSNVRRLLSRRWTVHCRLLFHYCRPNKLSWTSSMTTKGVTSFLVEIFNRRCIFTQVSHDCLKRLTWTQLMPDHTWPICNFMVLSKRLVMQHSRVLMWSNQLPLNMAKTDVDHLNEGLRAGLDHVYLRCCHPSWLGPIVEDAHQTMLSLHNWPDYGSVTLVEYTSPIHLR